MRIQAHTLILSAVIMAAAESAASAPLQAPPAPPKKTARPVRTAAPAAEDWERLKAQADAARETDQIPEAVGLYRKLVKLKPKWPEGWWYLGALQYERDQYAGAAEAFRKYLVLEPENGQGWGMLGLCEFRVKDYVRSLQHLTKARSLGLGGNEELARSVRYHQALLFTLGRQFEAALSVLNGFAVEHRESSPVLEAMGMAALRMPNLAEDLKPGDREAVRKFGKAQFLAGERRDDEAIEMFLKLEAEYRGRPNVAYAVATAMLLRGDHENALRYFKQELERDPRHVPAMIQYSLEAIALERFEEGLVHARKAAELEPDNFAVHYVQGRIYLYLGDLPSSIASLERAAALAPESAPVFYTLSQAYRRANRPADAEKALAEFRRLDALEKRRVTGVPLPEARGSVPPK
ncbi:MAG: tetratricopeptide repeat protein [Acidobacteria bacterium]|nr:tetratricopeptide repeat protein [Acidobacteriota bacterium]